MMKLFALIFCLFVTIFSILRALKLRSWLKLKGTVLGPSEGSGDSSHVRVKFIDPTGGKHEFTSGVGFGHNFRTPYWKRIPFKKDDEVAILVNPKNFKEAELNLRLIFVLPLLLSLASIYLACRLFYF